MQQTWEASKTFIGVEGKHKKNLKYSSSLHSYYGINTTTSGAHNEVVNPCICCFEYEITNQIFKQIYQNPLLKERKIPSIIFHMKEIIKRDIY